jgi:hypothetical protein
MLYLDELEDEDDDDELVAGAGEESLIFFQN